jgi:hypothetical protein
VLFGTVGCIEEQEPKEVEKMGIEVKEASIAAKGIFKNYLGTELSRISQDISVDNLIAVVDHQNEKAVYSIPSYSGSNYSLNFGISEQGDVINPFLGISVIISEKVIKTIYLTTDGVPMLEIIDDFNLNTRQVNQLTSANLRVDGWWSSVNNCLETLHTPTNSFVVNMLYVAGANLVTSGWYSPVSAVACAGGSLFYEYPKTTPPLKV